MIHTVFLKRWTRKFNQNINKKPQDSQYQEHHNGETIIQYKKTKKKKSDVGGEYVDFEDLNEHE